jgi:hypothetical protein
MFNHLTIKSNFMKKIILIAVLVVGTTTFALNSKRVNPEEKEKAVACCTVGEFTNCGHASQDLCGMARRRYCNAHPCSDKTIATLPQQ